MILVVGGSGLFMYAGFPLIPGPHVGIHHLYVPPRITKADTYRFTFTLSFWICLGSFFWASRSDPGLVTAKNHAKLMRAFPYDNILFSASKCTTCEFDRPARSKHCRICRRCVARYDHHCAWVNNDIGFYNLRWFLLFVACTAMQTSYVCYLTYYIQKYDLVRLQEGWQTGEWLPTTTYGLIPTKRRKLNMKRQRSTWWTCWSNTLPSCSVFLYSLYSSRWY